MTTELEAAKALRHLALDEDIKEYVLQHPSLYQVLLRAAMRFIGGETLSQCQATARTLNQKGFAITIDYMGESTRDAAIKDLTTSALLCKPICIEHPMI
ncbi:MAG: hypothetical protein F6K19_48985 [Cyanothece sp. SIO1E1]|nr:hypothetical protein [Cyanothece sp. SIO1E1]